MRALLPLLAVLALVGCDRAAEKAERQYEMVVAAKPHTYSEMCTAAARVAEARLAAGDQAKYETWKNRRDLYCGMAQAGLRPDE